MFEVRTRSQGEETKRRQFHVFYQHKLGGKVLHDCKNRSETIGKAGMEARGVHKNLKRERRARSCSSL
jgi:hypothetical protein